MSTPPLTPAWLRCAHQVNPLGVAPDRVALSWLVDGPGSGRAQTAYQVVVAAGEASAGQAPVVWDSGRVASAACVDIAYRGSPLTRGGCYLWRVRVWDENETVSAWSELAWF